MDETETEGAGGIGGEEAVACEVAFALVEGGGEIGGGVVVVMEMDFGFAGGGAAEAGEGGEEVGVVLLDGVEECVAEGLAGGIGEGGGEGGEIVFPAAEA